MRNIIVWNRKAEAIFGYSKLEIKNNMYHGEYSINYTKEYADKIVAPVGKSGPLTISIISSISVFLSSNT